MPSFRSNITTETTLAKNYDLESKRKIEIISSAGKHCDKHGEGDNSRHHGISSMQEAEKCLMIYGVVSIEGVWPGCVCFGTGEKVMEA